MTHKKNYVLSDIDLTVAADALEFCDPSDRDEWINMGMALKAEFGESAHDVWDQWSQKDSSYKRSSVNSSWKSFKKSGISIGTLIAKALNNGFQFDRSKVSDEDRLKLDEERKKRLVLRKKEQIEDEREIDIWRLKLSDFLISTTQELDVEGNSDYLAKKKIAGMGVLFSKEPMIIVADQERDLLETWIGYDRYSEFFKIPKEERPKFRIIKKGVFAVPLLDVDGRLWNLQIIQESGHKSFFPGKKQGCFHIIGQIPAVGRFNVCMAEGYANGACIHMALSCPVIIAFDSGNLLKVAKAFHDKYNQRISRFAICADDDQHLVREGKKNVGMEKALKAAEVVGGIVIAPLIDQSATCDEIDPLYADAVQFVTDSKKCTISAIQRKLKIGYNRAARMIELMETHGIVSPMLNGGQRKVLDTLKEEIN